MSPRSLSDDILREVPCLHTSDSVEMAVCKIVEAEVPALPVLDANGSYRGIFGEREFMGALFPGYLDQLQGAAFLPRSIDAALEKRETCRREPIDRYLNTDHVEVGLDHSDTQVAETFMHHRVLIIPVVDGDRVRGIITRRDFFGALAERFIGDRGAGQ
jgi:CBS domain-containing protein